MSCPFLRSWACLGQPAASDRVAAGSGCDCCLGCLIVARAEKALGDKFSAKEFNKALLDASATPRNVITRYIDEYIESAAPEKTSNK